MITVRVYGTPAPQGSKARGRNGGLYEMSKRVKPWRQAVAFAVADAITETPPDWTADTPVAVEIMFMMERPGYHYRKSGTLKDSAPTRPHKRPDLDKLARSTLDGIKAGGGFADDGQVADLGASKVYAPAGVAPGAYIEIRACKEET